MAKPDRANTHDWIGARVVTPDADGGQNAGRQDPQNPTTFHVWKCSADRRLYLITATDSIPADAPACPEGSWRFVKAFQEEGRSRVGFSEADAKRDMNERGFHIVRIDVTTTVSTYDDSNDA